MTCDPVRLGVAGLGRGFMLTLPSILADKHVRLVAAAAPRAESREAFVAEFGGRAYATIEELAADPDVEAVYIATPHQMHREHAEILAAGGKHLLVEKPLAISLDDATAIVDAAARAGVRLVTGPSHSFDQPVLAARRLIDEGRFGRVRMIHALNYTDFLCRPRRPEELSTELGGGVVFSQAVHQVDVVRVLMGGEALTVSAMTGAWDPARPTEGAYAALIRFDGGRFANLVYSGYAHFDSDTWQDDIGELGAVKDPAKYGAARRALATVSSPEEEAALKSGRTFGAVDVPPAAPHAEHFGPVIVSCDRADLRLTAKGIEVWGDTERSFIAAPADPSPRAEVLKGLYDAVRGNNPPIQSGGWGRASLELCHAILESATTGGPVQLQHQS
ncbi:Gfo/Idh/MocA family protein [Rhodobium gokarnense]|uniref:Phthalate 4,5-cis-dihydrodiol dehydrogenase n=1 Tax=Rhodobium gokarnense TaxID=364296 RepID=A0ABT3HAX2_9HYPH|nr:Gfo/Idh/MocA family oxidoreductase [Rhodobium gokarnense]MCW2307541.1 phthalate 4,5-cis-dihydrodiol dehydrogenase [Rhodobium gokarnense]